MRDLFGDKVERAIELLRMYQPKDRPYWGCFSGGKDSCVIKEIARIGDINVIWHYNVTTIDPPELVRFIKRHHPDVIFHSPAVPLFVRAETHGFPTRLVRWCCEEYKEGRTPDGEVMIFGVRAAESRFRRAAWKHVTMHTKTHQVVISPIIDWSDADVWSFILSKSLPYCELYDQGFDRLGCVGCPMSYHRARDLDRWPHFKRAWMRLFEKLWERKTGTTDRNGRQWFGDRHFSSWQEMWEWWLHEYPLQKDECQGILDFYV